MLGLACTWMVGPELKSLCLCAKLALQPLSHCSGMIVLMLVLVIVLGLYFSALCILGKCFVTEPHPPTLPLPSCKEGCVGCSFVWVSWEMFAVYFVWKMPCVQSPRVSFLLAGKPEVCMPMRWQVLVAGERLCGSVPKYMCTCCEESWPEALPQCSR